MKVSGTVEGSLRRATASPHGKFGLRFNSEVEEGVAISMDLDIAPKVSGTEDDLWGGFDLGTGRIWY